MDRHSFALLSFAMTHGGNTLLYGRPGRPLQSDGLSRFYHFYHFLHFYLLIFLSLMFDSVQGLVLTIISSLIIIIFVGSIYGFFRSIYLFIFSGGDTNKVKEARNGIRYMVLGIFLTLIFLFIFPVIFKKLELPGYEAYTAKNIFKFTSGFLGSILDFGKEVTSGDAPTQRGPTGSPSNSTLPPSPPAQQLEL